MEQTPEERREKPDETKPSLLKNILIKGLAILIILMLIFYFMTTPMMQNIIVGLFESSPIEKNSVEIGQGNTLFFENNTYNKLIEIYDKNPEREFKACLMGEVADGNYIIDEIFEPKTTFQSPNEVIAEPCPDETLVSLHSHPFRHCLPSEVDLKNFELLKKKNNKTLMAVMCEKGRFNFYR